MSESADLPARLRKIGEIERVDHFHLPTDGDFYFWGEYTPYEHTGGQNWNYSKTNQLIANLKKHPDRRTEYDWRFKEIAIAQVAEHFAKLINWQELSTNNNAMVVPMPSSRPPNDPGHDPRMLHVLQGVQMRARCAIGIRDCLRFDGSQVASHATTTRPTPAQLEACLHLDPASALSDQRPGLIVVVDDVVTTGAHFLAAKNRLGQHFPGVPFVGLAVARRVTPNNL